MTDGLSLDPQWRRSTTWGRCAVCGIPLEIRAALDSRRQVESYRLHCAQCGDAGAVPPEGRVRDALTQSLLDGQVREARHRCPLAGDRRAQSLIVPTEGESTDPAAHRRSGAGPHVLQRFDGKEWVDVAVSVDGIATRAWLQSEEDEIQRPKRDY
jgi:hypothetical protein